jgi:hypothetical protein
MTSKEFVRLLENISKMKTYYIKGGFGLVLNAAGKKRAINQYKYNADRADKINALDPHTFGFDCCGLVKGAIWGFTGDSKKTYGGAVYKANGLDDVNESGLLKYCDVISTDMKNILPGELLYMSGHCGVYLGDHKVCESTPSGKCGVQITDINRVKWTKHGKLKLINYETISAPSVDDHKYHYVKRGETLTSIARLYGMNWRQLWALNPTIKNPNLIYFGQKLIIK